MVIDRQSGLSSVTCKASPQGLWTLPADQSSLQGCYKGDVLGTHANALCFVTE